MIYNDKSFQIVWTPVSATAITTTALTTADAGQTIVLTNGTAITNPQNGITTYQYMVPVGNVRTISFSSTVAGAQFQISGQNNTLNSPSPTLNVQPLTEIVTCTNANVEYYSVNQYTGLLFITAVTIPANLTVEVGLGGGYTSPYMADVYNSVNNYSVAFTNMAGMSADLQYSLDNTTYFTANITQPPYVVAPAGLVNPIATNGMVSFINIPLAAIRVLVANSETGTMTVTILQQGGRY